MCAKLVIYNCTCVIGKFTDFEGNTCKTATKNVVRILWTKLTPLINNSVYASDLFDDTEVNQSGLQLQHCGRGPLNQNPAASASNKSVASHKCSRFMSANEACVEHPLLR